MTIPNFLLIGANKAGTTSMYWYLKQHPEIFVCPIKEPMYFAMMNNPTLKNNPVLQRNDINVIDNLKDYKALFSEVENEKAIGELSTAYLSSPQSAINIKSAIPDVKLIAILRDPAQRAYSNYRMYLRWGLEDCRDFYRVIRTEEQFLDNFDSPDWIYMKLGFYARALRTYYDLFPAEQIKIMFFEDMQKDATTFVIDIYRFLGVDDTYIPNVKNKENVSINVENGTTLPPFTKKAHLRLIEIFREDILDLQKMTGRDLSHWLEIPPKRIHCPQKQPSIMEPARLIAFYLPQYHTIPENDEWWGEGFTDWVNVSQARPTFEGHYQPHRPGEMGYYDLSDPGVSLAQTEMARTYGISAFCYYHYWFNGRRLLERPFSEVLASGNPDFPFCLCWANENWTRSWDGSAREILIQQKYSAQDNLQHIRYLINAFRDPRYVRVGGKPLFLVYQAEQLHNPLQSTDIWREEASKVGIELYLCTVETMQTKYSDPQRLGFDAAVDFQPDWLNLENPIRWSIQRNGVYDYASVVRKMLYRPEPDYKRHPCVTPGWDNTARRSTGSIVLHNSTPNLYGHWLETVLQRLETSWNTHHRGDQLVFINAWNEWAEGAHLEPDRKWDRGYLEATRTALEIHQKRLQAMLNPIQEITSERIEQARNDIMRFYIPDSTR